MSFRGDTFKESGRAPKLRSQSDAFAMALALAPWGVRVNAIGPGSINTDILKAVADDREAMQRILSRTPLNRLGDPDEIAGVAWFLANKDASYITGECIYADGGRLALNYTMKPEDYED